MSAAFHGAPTMHIPAHHLHHHHHHHHAINSAAAGTNSHVSINGNTAAAMVPPGVDSNGSTAGGGSGGTYLLDDGSGVVGGSGYPHDGVTPPGMVWDPSLQGDGGGKFRLKRRRRCGQCAPCQVKENCNKCQYCMRKDVLKQACIYRKCVYLRKPVPRFRQDGPPGSNGPSSPSNTVNNNGSAIKPSTTPSSKATTSTNNNINGISSDMVNSNHNSAANNGGNAATNTSSGTPNGDTNNNNRSNSENMPYPTLSPPTKPAAPGSAELSSCRLNQSPFGAANNSYQPRSGTATAGLYDPTAIGLAHSQADMANTSKIVSPATAASSTGLGVPTPARDTAAAAAAAAAATTYFPHPADSWGSAVPYPTLPRAPSWAASAYSFQQHSSPFAPSFASSSFPASPFQSSSCRLGFPDPSGPSPASASSAVSSRYGSAVPPAVQHPFHPHQGYASISGFPTASDALNPAAQYSHHPAHHHSNTRSSLYAPAPPTGHHHHLGSSSTLPSFAPLAPPSFGPSPYHAHPHSHMYPGSFYSSLRAATEPQIYHVTNLPSQNPFRLLLSQTYSLLDSLDNSDKTEKICGFKDIDFVSQKNNTEDPKSDYPSKINCSPYDKVDLHMEVTSNKNTQVYSPRSVPYQSKETKKSCPSSHALIPLSTRVKSKYSKPLQLTSKSRLELFLNEFASHDEDRSKLCTDSEVDSSCCSALSLLLEEGVRCTRDEGDVESAIECSRKDREVEVYTACSRLDGGSEIVDELEHQERNFSHGGGEEHELDVGCEPGNNMDEAERSEISRRDGIVAALELAEDSGQNACCIISSSDTSVYLPSPEHDLMVSTEENPSPDYLSSQTFLMSSPPYSTASPSSSSTSSTPVPTAESSPASPAHNLYHHINTYHQHD